MVSTSRPVGCGGQHLHHRTDDDEIEQHLRPHHEAGQAALGVMSTSDARDGHHEVEALQRVVERLAEVIAETCESERKTAAKVTRNRWNDRPSVDRAKDKDGRSDHAPEICPDEDGDDDGAEQVQQWSRRRRRLRGTNEQTLNSRMMSWRRPPPSQHVVSASPSLGVALSGSAARGSTWMYPGASLISCSIVGRAVRDRLDRERLVGRARRG